MARRGLAGLALALLMAVALAGAASAATQTVTKRIGPIAIGGYQVLQSTTIGVPTPGVDGYITHMDVNVVDKNGAPLPIQQIMLHHVVFMNGGSLAHRRHDETCDRFTLFDSRSTFPAIAERFYAAGEERAQMNLPPGYGYPIFHDDTWGMVWMLMNHRQVPDQAYVEYHMTVETGTPLQAVTPYWLDVNNCKADPIYNIPGTGPKGSIASRSTTITIPEAGRLVAGGGHVHGGGKDLRISEPTCANRQLTQFDPTWGLPSHPFYHVLPVLHEPGPINVTGMQTPTGFPLAKGDQLRLTADYDDSQPHTRVMGISIVYVAPDPTIAQPCGPLPTDVTYSQRPAGRLTPPPFTVPLTGIDPRTGRARTIDHPPGRRVRLASGATITVRASGFSVHNALVRRGAKLTWNFHDRFQPHNVTLADGPVGFGSKNLSRGTFSRRFTKRGTYRIFCALHPVQMTETVVVR